MCFSPDVETPPPPPPPAPPPMKTGDLAVKGSEKKTDSKRKKKKVSGASKFRNNLSLPNANTGGSGLKINR